jgi:hypothetical protein
MLNNLFYRDTKYNDKVNYLHHALVFVNIYYFAKVHWSISEIFRTAEVKITVLRDLTPSRLVDRYNV